MVNEKMDRLSMDVVTALSEQRIIQDNSVIKVHQEILLLASGLRSIQADVLKSTLNSLKDKYDLLASWNIEGSTFTATTSESFPSVDASDVEKDHLIDQWVRRTLLFKLYDIYRDIDQRLTRFPLIQMAKPLGTDSKDLKRNVFYLQGEYLLEYRIANGGNCTSDITQEGIRLCEDRSDLFERLGTLHVDVKSGNKSTRVKRDELFVAEERIGQLRELHSTKWDFTKLVELCEELNIAAQNQCYLAVAMILRAIMDHVPPLFGFPTFEQVVSNYKGGRAFKDLMNRMDSSIRHVADIYLHRQIRKKQPLPSFQQVNCTTELDVLLTEIMTIVH